mmetsp:Transcript_21486/g.48680  ORF Transcript_21486/g.48680 Transcript_21486/m.48680 type:complete len:80 (+) Transcript_21486:418-657(+)
MLSHSLYFNNLSLTNIISTQEIRVLIVPREPGGHMVRNGFEIDIMRYFAQLVGKNKRNGCVWRKLKIHDQSKIMIVNKC